jgi:hypothetical protein
LNIYHFDLFRDWEVLSYWLEEAKKRNKCLMWNKRCRSDKLEDKLFWYGKGPLPTSSTRKFGSAMYQWINNVYFDNDKYSQKQLTREVEQAKVAKLLEKSTSRKKKKEYELPTHLQIFGLYSFLSFRLLLLSPVSDSFVKKTDKCWMIHNQEEAQKKHREEEEKRVQFEEDTFKYVDQLEEEARCTLSEKELRHYEKLKQKKDERALLEKGWTPERREKVQKELQEVDQTLVQYEEKEAREEREYYDALYAGSNTNQYYDQNSNPYDEQQQQSFYGGGPFISSATGPGPYLIPAIPAGISIHQLD